jgi:hypothetical protein
MSEIVVEEEPEPLPGSYPINYKTGTALKGYELTLELAKQEDKTEVVKLSLEADAILTRAGYGLSEEDVKVEQQMYSLRRRIRSYKDEEHFRTLKTYFYIDSSENPRYCRSWTNESEQINYCLNEQRHERALFVRERLEAAFPESVLDSMEPRRLGGLVLAKLLRR